MDDHHEPEEGTDRVPARSDAQNQTDVANGSDPKSSYGKSLDRYDPKLDRRLVLARRFAELNGWNHSFSAFNLRELGRISPHSMPESVPFWLPRFGSPQNYEGVRIFDHLEYFRRRAPIALVTQPYHASDAAVKAEAQKYGLEVYKPPLLAHASFWYPGETHFYVFVRPGTEVKWLPEQTDTAAFFAMLTEFWDDQRREREIRKRREASYAAWVAARRDH